jgi:hypothetical protein
MNARRLEKERKWANSVRWLLATLVALIALIAPVGASANPPSNDNFANAEVLAGRFGWTDGDSTGATKEPGEPNHAGNPGGASLWYVWTAPSAGRTTIDLCYAEFDTLLAVYTGDELTNLQEVASNDNGCDSQSRLTFTALAGTTYRVAVDGANGAAGYFELYWWMVPANDAFADGVSISGDTGAQAGDTRFATRETGEPSHGGPGGASVWYWWTAPSNGPATFDLCSAEFDTLLGVYTGDDVSALTRVAANDDDCGYGSRVSFSATGGQVYRIAVDGYDGEQGEFALQWSRQALAPRNQVLPSIQGLPSDGATLSAIVGQWGGTPPFTFGYQWYRCSFDGSGCALINGAAQSTYRLTSTDVGSRIRVYVTATNAAGSSTATSGPTGLVSPVAPANVTPPNIIDEPYLGEEIGVDEGGWSGTEPFQFAYQWQRCDPAGNCVNIEGETDVVYTVVGADLKNRLRVIVTASNGAGSATAATSLTRRVTRRQFCVVPRVKGKSLPRARKAIRRAHCSVGRVRYARSRRARGRVVSQSLKPGARKAAGTKVNLVVSRGLR